MKFMPLIQVFLRRLRFTSVSVIPAVLLTRCCDRQDKQVKTGNLTKKKSSPLYEIGAHWIKKFFEFFRLERVKVSFVQQWKYGPQRSVLSVTV